MSTERKNAGEQPKTARSPSIRFARLPIYTLIKGLTKPALLTYIALLCIITRSGEVRTSRTELSKVTGLQEQKISTSIRELLSHGLIDRATEERGRYHFRVIVEIKGNRLPFEEGTKGVHWGRIPEDIIRTKNLTKNELLVFAVLSAHSPKGYCALKRKAISRKTGIDERSVTRATTKLENKGFITKKGDGGKSRPCEYLLKNKRKSNTYGNRNSQHKNVQNIIKIREQYKKHQDINSLDASLKQIIYLMNLARKDGVHKPEDLEIAGEAYFAYEGITDAENVIVSRLYAQMLEGNGVDPEDIEQLVHRLP